MDAKMSHFRCIQEKPYFFNIIKLLLRFDELPLSFIGFYHQLLHDVYCCINTIR